jgi:hypothetical protein
MVEGQSLATTMTAQPLSSTDIAQLPEQLPAWTLKEGKLHRELRFADFSEAFGFMARVALAAEALLRRTGLLEMRRRRHRRRRGVSRGR